MHGHRELFHSNLLSWFFDELPSAADAVFRPLTVAGSGSQRRSERERQHLDLVLHWPDAAPLVIENKVFSIPDLRQLDEYASVVEKWSVRPSLTLLSVSAPPQLDAGGAVNGWRYLSYSELAERIENSLPRGSSYEVETMRRYASLVRDIHQLMQTTEVVDDAEPVWQSSATLAPLTPQLRAALQKARAQRVAATIAEDLGPTRRPVKSALTNATPLVEWFGSVRAAGEQLSAGWQLQGNQFRRAVIFSSEKFNSRSAEARSNREEFCRAHPELFTFDGPLSELPQSLREFNHFAPDFVYRYVKVPALTIGELKVLAQSVYREIDT